MKIAVMGYSGSGKSTLAARLGAELGLPVLHLDRVNFLPGWRERDREEARAMTAAFLEKEGWVVDGNYPGLCQQERLEQADRIVLLLFGRLRCLWRAWRRSRQFAGRTRDSMAEGCEEKFNLEFLWWILHAGRDRAQRARWREICRTWPGKTVVLRSPGELEDWLSRHIAGS